MSGWNAAGLLRGTGIAVGRVAALLAAMLAVGACRRAVPAAPAAAAMSYPTGYRQWTHVKTAVVGPSSPLFESAGGIHHIYANDKALAGYRTGRFPDGSALVFDLLSAQEAGGLTSEGPRQRIDLMLKDARRFAGTGGWGFERFLGDSETDRPLTEEQRALCHTCHEQRKANDLVFSEYRK